MAKKNIIEYVCQQCGAVYPKWQGKCDSCGEWNTIEEEVIRQSPSNSKVSVMSAPSLGGSSPKKISEIDTTQEARALTGMGELDRVLGGGLVNGSLVLFPDTDDLVLHLITGLGIQCT